jgi:hypothetical protein
VSISDRVLRTLRRHAEGSARGIAVRAAPARARRLRLRQGLGVRRGRRQQHDGENGRDHLRHRACAAFLAISFRRFLLSPWARACPPLRPRRFEILTIIVLLNVAATIELMRRAARQPEKPKKKFRDRLWWGKPITPKHEPPPPLEAGMVRNPEQFSSDFEDFANVINWHLVDYAPWRVQELPTFELSRLTASHPAYGRRYAVFHNQARVGEIELEPDDRYSTET